MQSFRRAIQILNLIEARQENPSLIASSPVLRDVGRRRERNEDAHDLQLPFLHYEVMVDIRS